MTFTKGTGVEIISWTELVIGECPVTYDLVVTGFTPVNYPSASRPLQILDEDYCFNLDVTITSTVDGVSGLPADFSSGNIGEYLLIIKQ